tara:strand:- start:1532 stop:2305 length:774 start_codon:yes stop_codon:yes gene_type:complete
MNFGPNIVTNGLIYCIDSFNQESYISGSTTINTILSINKEVTGSLENDVKFLNNVWEFDGIDEFISINNLEPLMDSYADSTYNVWVKPEVTSVRRYIWSFTPNLSSYPVMGLAYTSPEGGSSLTFPGSFDVLAGISGANRTILCTTGSILPREWTNVCVTKQSGGNTGNKYNIKIYINGVDYNSTLVDDTSTSDWWNNNLISVGGLNNFGLASMFRPGSTSNYTDCNISSFSIYDKTLTSTEVLHNYNALKGRFGLT